MLAGAAVRVRYAESGGAEYGGMTTEEETTATATAGPSTRAAHFAQDDMF
jgi:hypothetical protein